MKCKPRNVAHPLIIRANRTTPRKCAGLYVCVNNSSNCTKICVLKVTLNPLRSVCVQARAETAWERDRVRLHSMPLTDALGSCFVRWGGIQMGGDSQIKVFAFFFIFWQKQTLASVLFTLASGWVWFSVFQYQHLFLFFFWYFRHFICCSSEIKSKKMCSAFECTFRLQSYKQSKKSTNNATNWNYWVAKLQRPNKWT